MDLRDKSWYAFLRRGKMIVQQYCRGLKENASAWSREKWLLFRSKYKVFIGSAEVLFAVGPWIGAVSAGSDITLWVPLLVFSWLTSSISIAAANLSPYGRKRSFIVITVFMALTGAYIWWAHQTKANIYVTGALPEIEPIPLTKMADGSYAMPVAVYNAGDLPILDREYIQAILFSPKILTAEEENQVPFFKKSHEEAENEWKKASGLDGVANAIRTDRHLVIYGRPIKLTDSQYEDVMSGKEHAYIFLLLKYIDSSIPSGNFYQSMYCGRFMPSTHGFVACYHGNYSKHLERKG